MKMSTYMCSFHVHGSICSGVGWNKMQTSSTKARHDTRNHLVWRVFHCGYNIFLVHVHVTTYKLLHSAFVRKQHFHPVIERPMANMSPFFNRWCQVLPVRCFETVLERFDVRFKIERIFLQDHFDESITICLIEQSSLGIVLRGRPDLFLS